MHTSTTRGWRNSCEIINFLTNASQATNTVLEAQFYCTCSQSTMPAQPSTLQSTCKAKLASVTLQLMLSCRDRADGVAPTEGNAIPGTGKGSPLLLPQQPLQALSWASPFQPVWYRRGEKNGPLPLLKEAETSHSQGAGGIKDVQAYSLSSKNKMLSAN